MDELLVGIDIETTGLEPEECRLLEVAIIVTDWDLEVRGSGVWTLKVYRKMIEEDIDPYVDEMHQKNGLWRDCESEGAVDRLVAQRDIVQFLESYAPARLIPFGSSVKFDIGFLKVHMPNIDHLLFHRALDLSSVRYALGPLIGREYATNKTGEVHRAFYDINKDFEALSLIQEELKEALT